MPAFSAGWETRIGYSRIFGHNTLNIYVRKDRADPAEIAELRRRLGADR